MGGNRDAVYERMKGGTVCVRMEECECVCVCSHTMDVVSRWKGGCYGVCVRYYVYNGVH